MDMRIISIVHVSQGQDVVVGRDVGKQPALGHLNIVISEKHFASTNQI